MLKLADYIHYCFGNGVWIFIALTQRHQIKRPLIFLLVHILGLYSQNFIFFVTSPNVLASYIIIGWKSLPGTNTLA
jgi:hypothetical protein